MMSNRSPFLASVACVLLLVLNVSAAEVLDPAKPDGGNEEWRMRHGERVADVRNNADKLEVLFIGDSITGGWLNIGKAVWEKEFVPLHAVNIGIAGSQTSHILWQFENGAIDGIRPRVAVLMIGVNNVVASPSHSAAGHCARHLRHRRAAARETPEHTDTAARHISQGPGAQHAGSPQDSGAEFHHR